MIVVQKFNLVPGLAYALVAILSGLIAHARARYLVRASRDVVIDESSTIILRPAKWSYVMPSLGVLFGGFLAASALSVGAAGSIIFVVLAFLMGGGGIWLLLRNFDAKVIIGNGKLLYTEGKLRTEIGPDEVCKVSVAWFSFRVRLRWQREVTIPATFESSEIILAFLRDSSDKNRSK